VKRANWIYLSSLIASALLVGNACAQQFVYPAKGQSAEQTDKDKYDCYSWAKQQTGFDPSQPTQVAAASSSAGEGQVVKTAARGAAVGAVGGAIAGDAGKGAAIGASTGALVGGMKKRDAKKEAQQQQQQQQAAANGARDAYNRAYKACLEGKGYSVQ
jgi:hypothetical protein